ncbi:DUF1963 domain-containing protein [Salmonella enterica subsp. enterica serovar Paratyphi A]
MDERIPCKNPQCSHFILPATAARTEGYCMPCVQARYRQEQEEYIRKNRKTIDAFSGITNPVEMLKLVHEPREHDPLIEWIPCPIPTDELYKKLSDDESRDMVDYAEELFDSGWQEEAQEIALCLAAFTQANLDNFLRQVINEEELELSSPLPFHRAPPDVRDALLQKVETDDENRDGILCALAWIGDEVVVEHFNRWRQEPPAWSASLHILPHRYAHQAGWELTENARRRDLYFTQCTHLVKQAPEQPAVFRAVAEYGENCPHCSLPLINLFEVAPSAVGLSTQGWPGQIRILTCQCCTAYNTVFATVDPQGQPRWYEKNALSTLAVENSSDWITLPLDVLHPGESRLPLFAAEIFLPTTFSQLGGHPAWVQDTDYPTCPTCAQTMMFLAQLSYEDIEEEEYAEGMLYGFICPSCQTTATSYQQT